MMAPTSMAIATHTSKTTMTTAVSNAIEHYRVDDILVSTFAGQQSQWIEDGLLDQIADITDKPVEHFESGGGSAASDSRQPVAAGAERSES